MSFLRPCIVLAPALEGGLICGRGFRQRPRPFFAGEEKRPGNEARAAHGGHRGVSTGSKVN